MQRFACFLLLVIVWLAFPAAAHAQEPTPIPTETPIPTVTPTPNYQQGVTLPSTGNTLLIARTVTYGDIAVVVSVLLLAAVELVKAFVQVPKDYMVRR
jgi:hypothetical protein